MDASDSKSTQSLTGSPPQSKSPSHDGPFKVPRATTSFKTSNPEIFPSLNPLASLAASHKKTGDSQTLSPSEDYQDVPLKKTKSENGAINILANLGSKLNIPDVPALGFLRDTQSAILGKEASKLTQNEQENIREYMENFYRKEAINEKNGNKMEVEKKENGPQFLMNNPNIQTAAKLRQNDMFKSLFSTLVREFELTWKKQLAGLKELEKWYSTDVPFNSPLSESINMLLIDRLSKKLKVEHEAFDLVHKAQNVYEISQDYRHKANEYVKAKGGVPEGQPAKSEKKVEKTKIIVLDGSFDASSSRIGFKRSLEEMEGKEKGQEIKETA